MKKKLQLERFIEELMKDSIIINICKYHAAFKSDKSVFVKFLFFKVRYIMKTNGKFVFFHLFSFCFGDISI